jgi:nitrite reductase/ring-hydroxylating ferredoxin subunit
MAYETPAGAAADIPPGMVRGAGRFAVGNDGGERFAVTRRCRHLLADLARGTIDDEGCLVCPWHGSRYNTETGQMVSGPQGFYDKIPGLEGGLKALTHFLPLGVGEVIERDGQLSVRRAEAD